MTSWNRYTHDILQIVQFQAWRDYGYMVTVSFGRGGGGFKQEQAMGRGKWLM